MKTNFADQIHSTTEARRSNGLCDYGSWLALDDIPDHVADAIVQEVAECMFADVCREESRNTDDAGEIVVGGERWVYRR